MIEDRRQAHQILELLQTFAELVPHHEEELKQLLYLGSTHGPKVNGTTTPSPGPSSSSSPSPTHARLKALVTSLNNILEGGHDNTNHKLHPHRHIPPAAASSLSSPPAAAAAAIAAGCSYPSYNGFHSHAVEGGNASSPRGRTCGEGNSIPGPASSSSPRHPPHHYPQQDLQQVCQSLSLASISSGHHNQQHQHQSPVSRVLSSTDLLHMIFAYLVTDARPEHAREALGTLMLVSKRFKTLASWDGYWRPVAVGLLPVLAAPAAPGAGKDDGKERSRGVSGGPVVAAAAAATAGGTEGSASAEKKKVSQQQQQQQQQRKREKYMVEEKYREYLMKYGNCLRVRRARMGEALEDGYTLGFEVWDAADGLRMLSASGPIRVQIDQSGGFTSLRIGGGERREVRGPAFSAATRDPVHRRFTSMEDFFSRGHLPEFEAALAVRVTVTDERTGRMALLWSTKKDSAYLTEAPLAYWEPYLLEGSISCFLDHWSPLMCPSYDGESMTVTIGFHVCPEPDQEEVPEQEKLYRLAGGDVERYEEHQSYISITFMTLNTNGIHQFFRSLLKDD